MIRSLVFIADWALQTIKRFELNEKKIVGEMTPVFRFCVSYTLCCYLGLFLGFIFDPALLVMGFSAFCKFFSFLSLSDIFSESFIEFSNSFSTTKYKNILEVSNYVNSKHSLVLLRINEFKRVVLFLLV